MDLRLLRTAERLGWALLLGMSLPAVLLLGAPVGLGFLAGGALALASYACLVRVGRGFLAAPGSGALAWWWLGSALRHLAAFAVLALLFSRGGVHPLAVAAGLGVLPVVLIALGLRPSPEG